MFDEKINIDLKNSNKYDKEIIYSVNRSWYVKKIKEEYKVFLKTNKYPLNENNYNSDTFSNYEKKLLL